MIDKVKILANLKGDMESADSLRLATVAKVTAWKNEYNGQPYGNEQEKKSSIVSRDIKRQDEWQHSSLKDPFLSSTDIVKCYPVTAADRLSSKQNQLILNYQFTRKFNRYKFITDAIKLLTTEGTVVAKTSWDYEDETLETDYDIYEVDNNSNVPVKVGTKAVKHINVLVNKPYVEVCRIEDIYIDPTCQGDLDKCQFVVHRYETDLSTLRTGDKYKKQNLDKISVQMAKESGDYQPEHEKDGDNFEFKDKPRKKIIVHEYWGNYDIEGTGIAVPIVCTWVNDIIIRLESNPYPDNKIPFLIVAHNSTPFQITGEANAEMIGDNQKIATAIKRGIIDNMANSNNGQKGMRKGALDTLNRNRFLAGRNFEFNGSSTDFFEGGYNSIPASAFQILEMNSNDTDALTGIKSFTGGISGGSLGSTARAAGGVLDAVSVRRLDIVRNVSENLIKPLMRKWMAYNSKWLQEEEVIRITDDEFIPIKRDDLSGAVDIQIQVSTAEDDAAKSSELSFLLQTNGPNEDPGVRKIIMSEIMDLHKMPDVAKLIREYQPQPDPHVEEMKSLEIRKLKAEIMERESRAAENSVDIALKTEKAHHEKAKTANLNSQTDLNDFNYVNKASGSELQDELTLKSADSLQHS